MYASIASKKVFLSTLSFWTLCVAACCFSNSLNRFALATTSLSFDVRMILWDKNGFTRSSLAWLAWFDSACCNAAFRCSLLCHRLQNPLFPGQTANLESHFYFPTRCRGWQQNEVCTSDCLTEESEVLQGPESSFAQHMNIAVHPVLDIRPAHLTGLIRKTVRKFIGRNLTSGWMGVMEQRGNDISVSFQF